MPSIDKDTFTNWMSTFAQRFGRELPAIEARLYYAILSSELDTEQFVQGCVTAFGSARFWPTPQEIIDGAPAATVAAAERNAALRQVLTIVNGYAPLGYGGRLTRESGIQQCLGPAVLAAYQAAGGFERFRALLTADDTTGTRHPSYEFVRRDFLAALANIRRAEVSSRALARAQQAALKAGEERKRVRGDGPPALLPGALPPGGEPGGEP